MSLLSCAKASRPVSSSLAATSSSARASSPSGPSGSSGTAATCASSSSIAIAPHSAWPCAMDDARESRPSAKNPSSPTEDARDSLPIMKPDRDATEEEEVRVPSIMKSVMPVSASSSSSSSSSRASSCPPPSDSWNLAAISLTGAMLPRSPLNCITTSLKRSIDSVRVFLRLMAR